MSVDAPRLPCFLVEWYRPQLNADMLDHAADRLDECATVMCGEGSPVHLLMTLGVPSEEVLFGVFAASAAQSVSEVCERAGIPAQRLTEAVDARIAG
jgi:hypothetical protein